ncbi:FprA family A-type flavoprotein [Oligosphaera ethanolica]|jgi:flavorubredoxin|uniref:Flavorubredoxin n=1 Tax=Oligosphaera ethanolica TaxID=760260 RepID=A0AAE3VFT1_9BACT|nr:FprA family A-type flavoprotein [Oligosphaera ethanolica]MDQ0289724.1 flavorubredoxin [Oligosphaera ethanolica]HQL09344.1 FprA family A-type flavoprotein [Lentisphaeria bacterium]
MIAREIRKGIQLIATVHWERRLFDSLIPLPDGTSYNAYLVEGSKATALIDTTDPAKADDLLGPLANVKKLDYIISQHSEQDHSGLLPLLLERYPAATLLCSRKAEEMLISHLHVAKERIKVVEDGETLSLGDKTLQFIYTPWVHWPETMVTYLPEERCLFSCDFLGSHLATSDLYVTNRGRTYEAAKRYFAEIMMPFRNVIQKNLDKISALPIDIIAPSHGPVYDDPSFIIDAYRDWVSPGIKNEVVIPYISMHGSTELMVKRLADSLVKRGVKVHLFDLSVTDIGALAITLVDAATIVVATPTVHIGPHPMALYAAQLANMLRPKAKYAAVLVSYGWSSKAIEQIAGAISNLKVEVLGTILQKGMPDDGTYTEIDALAEAIAEAHKKDPLVCG